MSKYQMTTITDPTKTTLKTKHHRILAHVEIDSRGVHRISDHCHITLGYYDPRTNRTTDAQHRLLGYGFLLPKLISVDLAEEGGAGTIPPEKPLTPAQNRREAGRRAKVQGRIKQAATDYQTKLHDLRSKL